MRISVKARYGVSTMIYLAQHFGAGEYITVASLSEKLKISKIYLEQVFALLKRANLVISTKGSQGGYYLSKSPKDITVFDILYAIETPLFEKTADTVLEGNPSIENVMRQMVYHPLDTCLKQTLSQMVLSDLALEAGKVSDAGYMYYL